MFVVITFNMHKFLTVPVADVWFWTYRIHFLWQGWNLLLKSSSAWQLLIQGKKSYEDETKTDGINTSLFWLSSFVQPFLLQNILLICSARNFSNPKKHFMSSKETVVKGFVSVNLLLEKRYKSGIPFNS